MKKSMNCLLGVLSLWCVSNQGANAQINKMQDYENKKSATIGSFHGITFKEGGFSGLFAIPNTNGKEFWTVSDRGVNVDAANANTPSCKPTYDKIYAFPNYAPKIHRIKIQGDSVQILQTISIKRPNGTTATGIINPTGFGSTSVEVASTDTVQNCANFNNKIANKDVWGIDSEGITVDKDGNFWLCEEGGPTIWKVDKNGVVLKRYTPYATKVGAESQDVAIDTVFAYRKNNRGFEGITITPNGKVYAIIQSPILFPSKAVGEGTKIHRILEIDPTNNTSKMYAYLNEGIIGASGSNQIRLRDWKIGDLTAINDTTFLVLEAALRGTSDIKKMYKININGATPVLSGISYDNNTKSLEALVNETGLANNNIIPVKKTLYMDLLANGWPALLEKAEGLTIVNDSTIAIANDNDYGQYSPTENGVATATGLNCHVYTYGLSGKDKLSNFVQPNSPSSLEKTLVSSSASPYLKSLSKDVMIDAVLTVGDTASNGYKMVGLADGTGAYDNNDGTFTMLINHEIGTTLGVPRLHGKKGAFISKWIIDKKTFQVTKGQDLISKVKIWNKVGKKYEDSAAVFNRFCSADLPMTSAFYNAITGKGSKERIFMNGEEAGAEGRAFAHVVTGSEAGISYELPRLGKFSFENVLASPIASDNTVVIGTDDATPGQVYVYVGTKTNSGTEIEKAGLTNGKLYGVVVKDLPAEISNTAISPETSFSLVDLGNVTDSTGAQLEAFSTRNLVTKFLRPEDGVWDPTNPNDFYFVTTNNFTSPSRMYRLSFKDATNPALGGAITAVLDGTEGPKMMDNITMDKNGKVYIQEDPGNQDYLASIWKYDVNTDAIEKIAEHDNDRFTTSGSRFLTKDEESSGIIDMEDILGKGHFMLVDQAHYAIAGETVEGGQILHMVSNDTINNRLVASVSSVNTTICGLKDGSTNVVVNKGVSPYSYNWKVAKTTDANLTNVGAGLDTLVVTDKIGKKIVIPIAINYNTLPNLNVDVIDPTCFGSKGTAEVKMTSELADYSFSWSNSATTLKQELASGSYVVDGKLKLNNNVECKVSSNVKITEPEQLVVETKTSKETDVVGSAVLMVTGGVKPYTYLWSTNSENDTLLGSAGEYTYVVKDANKCTIDGKVTIEKETTSGLSTLTKEFLDLYPNPTNGQVQLDWKGEGKVGIQIQSLTGSIMANYNVEGRSKSTLDLSNYAKGTYMIVISAENFNQTIKVIKE
ncbi:MAG: esterase-like activity of phytase family protein [Crocinitomicaceae bacterium]|nr:esterase-like activity of phytase family protein [Crocinitomicaceae bacterium]